MASGYMPVDTPPGTTPMPLGSPVPAKVAEDKKLSKGSGPIRPLSRVDKQLSGERHLAAARRMRR